MAKPSRKSYLKHYKRELERARRFRDEEGYDRTWERMIDMYRGKMLPQVETREDRIVVNIAFGTINVIAPSIAVNYPKITVNPNTPMDEDRALIVEAVVNHQWKHHSFQDQFRRSVKDYLVLGHGWLKVGYRYEEAEEPLGHDEQQDTLSEMQGEADTYAEENPDMAGLVPTDDEIMQHLPETKVVITEDRPFVERVSPFDMYIDPEATCMDDARWICQKIVRPLSEVRRDQRYKKKVRENLKADMGTDTREERHQRSWLRRSNTEPEEQRVTIYEWYDTAANTMSVCAEGSDEFLVDPQPIPFAFGHPFVMLRNYDVPDFFYPMGDLEAIESLQLELNKARSQAMGVRKSFARKHLYRAGAFDSIGRQALESDKDGTMVPVADDNRPFTDLIAELPRSSVPPDIFNIWEQIEQDITDVSGVSEYQRGQMPETRRTATEAAIISDSVNARAADKLAQIEQSIGHVARRVVAVLQQFMTADQVARVVGPDGEFFWVPYNAEDVEGEYDFEVEGGSTQPQNETVRRQEATALMQAMAPFIEMGVVDPVQLAMHVLRYGFGVKTPQKFMVNPEMAMMMQQQQMQQGLPGQQGPNGQGGPQGAPMGGGFPDESGVPGNELPPELTQAGL